MAKSIIQDDYTKCFLCGANGSYDHLEEHHVFGGANRKLSEKDGMKVRLCGNKCHRNGKMSVHHDAITSIKLKRIAQMIWIKKYGSKEDFMKRYGKNYLG